MSQTALLSISLEVLGLGYHTYNRPLGDNDRSFYQRSTPSCKYTPRAGKTVPRRVRFHFFIQNKETFPRICLIFSSYAAMIFEGPRTGCFATLASTNVWHVTRYLFPGRAAFSISFGMSIENTLSISYTRLLSNRLNLEMSLISRSDRRNFSTLTPRRRGKREHKKRPNSAFYTSK